MANSTITSDSSESPVLARELAETLLLLDYLSNRPDGHDLPSNVIKSSAPSQQKSEADPPQVQQIELDLGNTTALARRVYAIKASLGMGVKYHRDGLAAEAAFLLRAKSILTELSFPATSLTIAFTSMVFDAMVGIGRAHASRSTPSTDLDFERSTAELAFPNFVDEARRLARSIRYFIPASIALVTIGMAIIVGLGNAPAEAPYRWLARAAFLSGVVPALLGLLGALASILRRFQQLAAARLLDPGQRSKNLVEAWLGLIAGSAVGFLGASMWIDVPGVPLALFAAAFLAGYSTELAFSLLDLIIVRLSRTELFRDRTPQLNTVLKTQSAIASTVAQIHNQIEQIQGNVTLDPFDGAVIVRVRGPNGEIILFGEHSVPADFGEPNEIVKVLGAKLLPGQPYELSVTLERQAIAAANAAFERVTTGTESEPVTVTFDVHLNARDISFTPKAEAITIESRSRSAAFASRFLAPSVPGRYDIFAEVSQKNRLVQVALLPALIESASA